MGRRCFASDVTTSGSHNAPSCDTIIAVTKLLSEVGIAPPPEIVKVTEVRVSVTRDGA